MLFKVHFRDHFFSYLLVLLVIVVATISYYRFMVKQDYLIGYEGKCDPALKSCFVGCNDDSCTDEYYYSKVQKYAPDLFKECGADITDCTKASVCLPIDQKCSIVYCDQKIDGKTCKLPTETTDYLQGSNTNNNNL